jgi:hypothetical protein
VVVDRDVVDDADVRDVAAEHVANVKNGSKNDKIQVPSGSHDVVDVDSTKSAVKREALPPDIDDSAVGQYGTDDNVEDIVSGDVPGKEERMQTDVRAPNLMPGNVTSGGLAGKDQGSIL